MREIKFRVWFVESEKMYSWEDLIDKIGLSESVFVETKLWKPMQYTGLKDKNGKGDETYQGDLIIYPNKYRNAGNPIEIIWKDGAWRGRYVNTDDTKFIFILNAKEMEDAEIIGNIHQKQEKPK